MPVNEKGVDSGKLVIILLCTFLYFYFIAQGILPEIQNSATFLRCICLIFCSLGLKNPGTGSYCQAVCVVVVFLPEFTGGAVRNDSLVMYQESYCSFKDPLDILSVCWGLHLTYISSCSAFTKAGIIMLSPAMPAARISQRYLSFFS